METVIEMKGITKQFPGILANDSIDLEVTKGSIHALLGENGAGKSTLMSILFGLIQPDSGNIKINGQEVKITDPNVATRLGIGMVHQHFKLVHNFTVTQNIILGAEPCKQFGIVDLKQGTKKIRELCKSFHLEVDPEALIEDISVGQQQRTEILKMLYREAEILVFDEPTAVLTPQEVEDLMKILRSLAASGKTVVLITHKLKEIKAVADVVTILRRGKVEGTYKVSEINEKEMAAKMVGRQVQFAAHKKAQKAGDTILQVENLTVLDGRGIERVKGISFDLHKGEILGIAGIDGNGQDELVYAITGLLPVKSGRILLNGEDITELPVKNRFEAGLGHVPSDRHRHGLILDFLLKENFIIHAYNSDFAKHGLLDEAAINQKADQLIEEFDVRASLGRQTITRNMSGGNQQKAIVAREIDRSPELLIIVQPTRGLDVGAIEYIHSRILEQRENQKAILLVSFELDEILALCDRILVMANGEISGEKKASQTDEKQLGLLMLGHKSGETYDQP